MSEISPPLTINGTFYGCIAGSINTMALCCDQLGDAWISCTGDDYICESALNGYTGLPSNTTSRGVSMGGSGVGGGMMIVMLLLGLMVQITLNT
ncbi:hypothetical protein M405DRAFT_92817 [Rhizopogon salebrosus TDB-379]|nr:hypothetical protein M405DRAFT_92817 [Rhizopogon salebrosus TDB-379]